MSVLFDKHALPMLLNVQALLFLHGNHAISILLNNKYAISLSLASF